jgi:hypothetical protein
MQRLIDRNFTGLDRALGAKTRSGANVDVMYRWKKLQIQQLKSNQSSIMRLSNNISSGSRA